MNLRILPFVLALLAGTSAQAAAQAAGEPSVVGRIIGPDNAAVAGQEVILHRVEAAVGATVAEAVTGADGSFRLGVPASVDTSAIFFVGTRFQGELYIGPPFRAGDEGLGPQIIQVGVPGTSATALLGAGGAVRPGMAQPRGRPLTSRNWMLLVIPLAGVAAVAIYALVPRSHVPRERAALIRIAELDEHMARLAAAERVPLAEERARLLAQLRTG